METQDLIAFRIALRDLHGIQPADDRRQAIRYTPTGALSQARVRIGSANEVLDADVVDLSPNGMRLAVGTGVACKEGDPCTIMLELIAGQRIQLTGEVRWTKHHPFITVFGVLLEPDHNPIQPV